MSKKETSINLVNKEVRKVIADGFNNEAVKEKVQEYIEVSKLKLKIAKEIVKLSKESLRTEDYLSDLEKDIALAEKDLDEANIESEILK